MDAGGVAAVSVAALDGTLRVTAFRGADAGTLTRAAWPPVVPPPRGHKTHGDARAGGPRRS